MNGLFLRHVDVVDGLIMIITEIKIYMIIIITTTSLLIDPTLYIQFNVALFISY